MALLSAAARSGGLLLGHRRVEHAHDVALLHDQEFDAIEFDFGAGPLAEQHAVADLHVDRDELAGLVAPAGTDGDDLALLRLFLCGVGNNDPAGGLLFSVDALDDDTVVKRTELHGILLSYCCSSVLAWRSGETEGPPPIRPRHRLAVLGLQDASGGRDFGLRFPPRPRQIFSGFMRFQIVTSFTSKGLASLGRIAETVG